MLIGLSGKKGSGKDTACKFILEWAEANYMDARRDAFADRLKLSAARIFFPEIELEEALIWCNRIKNEGNWLMVGQGGETVAAGYPDPFVYESCLSGREFLQRYGTEAHRNVFDQDFWLHPIAGAYLEDEDALVIVTDVRFDNEAELINELGGTVWEIVRPSVEDEDTHVSETPISRGLVNRFVNNNSDLDTFRSDITSMMDQLWKVVV